MNFLFVRRILVILTVLSITTSTRVQGQSRQTDSLSWELGYDVMPNLKSLVTGKAAASLIVKKYFQNSNNPYRLKVLFNGDNIDSQKSTDTLNYTKSHRYLLELHAGKEWRKNLFKRASLFFGVDMVYRLDYEDASMVNILNVEQSYRKSNGSAYGISPFLGVSYGICKGLYLNVETHLNAYRTFIHRTTRETTNFSNASKFVQKGSEFNFQAIDMLYVSIQF